MMRHFLCCLLLACASPAIAQIEPPEPLPYPDGDPNVLQGGLAWLVGDHVKARRHFRAAAQRGDSLGQYNLAMMLLHREGGLCGAAEAEALLRKAAAAGVVLASEALDKLHDRSTPRQAFNGAFPCPLPTRSRPTTVAGPIKPAPTR